MTRGIVNQLTGKTDGKLNSSLRSALRMQWGYTVKQAFVKSVRYKKGGKFHVKCAECGKEMAISDKQKPINKDGSLSKRKAQKLYDVDHLLGITPLEDPIYGLGAYWESMMTGPLQILCKSCHSIKTAKQATERSNNK